MSLRVRLVLVAAAAVAAAVVLASVIVYFIVSNDLNSQVNSSLRVQAAQISRTRELLVDGPGPRPHELILRAGFGLGEGGFPPYFQIVGSDGNYYVPDYVSTPLPLTSRVRSAASVGTGPYFTETHAAGTHVRVLTVELRPVSPTQTGLALQVAASLEGVDHELGRIRLWLILVALGGTGVAAGAGFLVARSALRPVRRFRDTAENVRTTRDLTQRIDVTGSDELSQLATTFNAMLASLDDAAQRQRQLVQDASHELRTPLTSLRTNIEVLASSDAVIPDDERRQILGDVVAQLSEMTELIGELTELARGEEQQPALEDVRLDLVTEEAIRRTARNHPDVPIDAELAPTTTVGTPATLERAIANLLDNAAKWSPAGTRIEVQLRNHELTVRDRGPGIAESDLPRIFDRFYRATSARSMPGSGLGLAIVKQVAEAHGGTIAAERAPEGGTIMRLTFGSENGSARASAAKS